MTDEHVFGIESIKVDYQYNLLTPDHVKDLIGILLYGCIRSE